MSVTSTQNDTTVDVRREISSDCTCGTECKRVQHGQCGKGAPPTPRVSTDVTNDSQSQMVSCDPLSAPDSRCVIPSILFTHIRHLFETAYGLILKRDLCSSKKNSYLPLHGFPRSGNKCENAVYINAPPSMMNGLIKLCKVEKIVALFVVPAWPGHLWYDFLKENATHRFILPLGQAVFPGKVGAVHAFIWDSRYDSRATDLITIHTPSIEKCMKNIYSPHQILSLQSADFLSKRPRPHFSTISCRLHM